MNKIVLLTILIATSFIATAQNIKYNEEPAIKELTEKAAEVQSLVKGFRVQLYSSSNYENAKKARFDFLQLFPETSAYLKYQQPNYKIRVGNFRSRLEAEKFKAKLQETEQFKSCFIVPDKINYPKL